MNELNIVEKVCKDNTKAYLLVEPSGTICGIYATEADALKSMPAIIRNVNAFEENGTLVKVKPKRPRRKKGRRKSRPSQKKA